MALKVGRVTIGPDGRGASCPTSLDAQQRGTATAHTPLCVIFPVSGDERSPKALGLGFF